MIVITAVLALLSLGAVVGWLAHMKGRPVMPWGVYGTFLGPVALPHVLLLQGESGGERRWSPIRSGLPSGVRPCPHCYAPVHAEAIACRFCRKPFYESGGDNTAEQKEEEPRPSGREFEALERALARSGVKTRQGFDAGGAAQREGSGPAQPETSPSPSPSAREERRPEEPRPKQTSSRSAEGLTAGLAAARAAWREDPPMRRARVAPTDPAPIQAAEDGGDAPAAPARDAKPAQPVPPQPEAGEAPPEVHGAGDSGAENRDGEQRPDEHRPEENRPEEHRVEDLRHREGRRAEFRPDPTLARHSVRLTPGLGAARATWREDPPLRHGGPAPIPANQDDQFAPERPGEAVARGPDPVQHRAPDPVQHRAPDPVQHRAPDRVGEKHPFAAGTVEPPRGGSWEYREARPSRDRDSFMTWPPIERYNTNADNGRWMPAPVALALVSIITAAFVFGPDLLDSTGPGSDSSRWLVENDPGSSGSGVAAPAVPPEPPAQEVPPRGGEATAESGAVSSEARSAGAADSGAVAPPAPPASPGPLPVPPPRTEAEVAAAPAPAPPQTAAPDPISASGELVAGVQRQLKALGYSPGPIDGRAGTRTRNALRAYQRDQGLPITGEIDATVLFQLGFD